MKRHHPYSNGEKFTPMITAYVSIDGTTIRMYIHTHSTHSNSLSSYILHAAFSLLFNTYYAVCISYEYERGGGEVRLTEHQVIIYIVHSCFCASNAMYVSTVCTIYESIGQLRLCRFSHNFMIRKHVILKGFDLAYTHTCKRTTEWPQCRYIDQCSTH